jgi:hypothetical protein
MDNKSDISDACIHVARTLVEAAEALAMIDSREDRASLLNEFQALADAISRTRFFTKYCLDPDKDKIQLGDFQHN